MINGYSILASFAFGSNCLIALILGKMWPDLLLIQGRIKTKIAWTMFSTVFAIYLILSVHTGYWAYRADWWMIFVMFFGVYHPAAGISQFETPEDHPWRKYMDKIWIIPVSLMLIPILYLLGCVWYLCGGFLLFEDQSFGSILIDFIMSVIALLYVLATLVLIFKR